MKHQIVAKATTKTGINHFFKISETGRNINLDYMLANYSDYYTLSKNSTIKIPVHPNKTKDGRKYVESIPNGSKNDNINSLPDIGDLTILEKRFLENN